ncbi:MAG: response regulator [Gemmatimonadota bacterium]
MRAEKEPELKASADEIIRVYAPTGDDAELTSQILSHGRRVEVESSLEQLCDALSSGAGAVIVAEEALLPLTEHCLLDAMSGQPSWSDLPVIILTSALSVSRPMNDAVVALCAGANVILMERPLHPVTLVAAVESALRARRRQYQVRDYLNDRERAEERVRQAQKMEAVGQLAGGVAHEVNNMMTAVIGFGELALRRLGDQEGVRSDVEEMVKAGYRAAAITQQLLAFSRQQVRQPKVLQVEQVVCDLSKLLRRLLGADLELELRLPAGLGAIRADRNQLEQVLINLTMNARDAMRPGGKLGISGEMIQLDESFRRHHGLEIFRPGPYLLLAVSDTGSGMDTAVQERAFDPFFTTKPVGKGTGLGLSSVYGIVKQSDGYIWLYSEPEIGTTFKIYLPIVQVAAASEAPVPPARNGHETILVAEDEDLVRRLIRSVLEERGYRVLEAMNGVDALRVLAAHSDPIDALLTDTVMPRMGGLELARRARAQFPRLPVLFMSGYAGDDIRDRGLLEPGVPFVQKPFSPNVLAERVRWLLDGTPASPPGLEAHVPNQVSVLDTKGRMG